MLGTTLPISAAHAGSPWLAIHCRTHAGHGHGANSPRIAKLHDLTRPLQLTACHGLHDAWQPAAPCSRPSSAACSTSNAEEAASRKQDESACIQDVGIGTTGEGGPSTAAEQSHLERRPLWHVPWDDWHTAGVMVQLWALMLPLGFGGVAIVGQLRGLTPDAMGPADRAVAAAASEAVQLAGAAVILRGACGRYRPLPRPWFNYQLNAGGLLNGAAAGVSSLAAVSLVVAALAALAAAGQQAGGGGSEIADSVPRSQEEIGAILGSGGAVGTAAAAAASVVLAPALEELVYRGFLLPSLSRQLPTAAAVVLSSAAFAAAHLSAADAAPLLVLGCMLGTCTVAAEGSLVAPTLAHIIYNAAVFAAVAARSAQMAAPALL